MKYALLVSKTLSNGDVSGNKNIGDYIQSLAAAQFLPRIDEYYDKTADDNGSEIIKMIMNGWYIWHPEKFPLSERIIPLPISMHISPFCANKLLSIPKVLDWFKLYEPIGCRDKETEFLLSEKGIKTYFSGCLTLTLGRKYKYDGVKSGLIFVDPYIASIRNKELSLFSILKILFYCIIHFKAYLKLHRKFEHNYCNGRFKFIKRVIYIAIFMTTYSKLFSLQELLKADYFTHIIKVGKETKLQTEYEKMSYAEQLVRKYASAKLVVTGRIHCALPCLGVETPVLFTIGYSLQEGSASYSSGRFGGLLDFFNVIRVNKTDIKINFNLPKCNKNLYKQYEEELEKKCLEFIKEEA